jgi:hypothetical protein
VILSVISNITLCPSSDTINVTVVTAPIAAIVASDSVVCAGESLPTAERALAWPARSGKLVLRLALDRVAEFYRLK